MLFSKLTVPVRTVENNCFANWVNKVARRSMGFKGMMLGCIRTKWMKAVMMAKKKLKNAPKKAEFKSFGSKVLDTL